MAAAVLNLDTAGELNFIVRRGTTFDVTVAFKDGAGAPISLTGKTVRMQVRDDAGYLILTFEGASAAIDINGNVRLYKAKIDVSTGSYQHDVFVYDGALNSCWLQGDFQINQNSTEPAV